MADGVPGQLLQQAIEFPLLVLAQVFHLRQIAGHRQADGTAAIDHREMTIAVQHLQGRCRMAPRVAEQIPLLHQPRRLAGDDLLAQRHRSLPDRHGDNHVLAKPFVDVAAVFIHVVIIPRLGLPQLREVRGIVVHLRRLARLQRIDRHILVVGQPEFLDRDPEVRVVDQAQLRKLLDAYVGQPDGREREHVHFAGAQRGLALVLLFRHVPMLVDPRAADARVTDGLMVRNARRLGHLAHDAINERVKTVRACEHALARRNGRDRLVSFFARAASLQRCQQKAGHYGDVKSGRSQEGAGSGLSKHGVVSFQNIGLLLLRVCGCFDSPADGDPS